LNIGKWLQNAGWRVTYLPAAALLGIAAILWVKHDRLTQFTARQHVAGLELDTVNFWSQIAFLRSAGWSSSRR